MTKYLYLILGCLLLFCGRVFSQEKSDVDIFEMSFEELANIKIVSATKIEQTISEAPAIISIITRRQIRNRGYRTVGEALQSVAGLDLLHDRFQYNLGIRGINGGMRAWSRIIKLMIDGQPVAFRSSYENFLGNELVPIDVVERIEIIRGPASALYGANAFLGVINIITRQSEAAHWGAVATEFSSAKYLDGVGSSVTIGGKSGNLDFMVAGTFHRRDQSGVSPVNVPGNAVYGNNDRSANDIAKPRSLYGRLHYDTPAAGRFSFDVNYQEIDSYADFQDWGALTHNNRINLRNYYIRGKYVRTVRPHLIATVSTAYSKGNPGGKDRLDNDTDPSDWITREVGYKGLDVTTELIYHLSASNSVAVGVDHTRDNHTLQTHFFNNAAGQKSPRQGIQFGNKNFSNTGVYAQSIMYPVQSLGLTAGVRYDVHNIYQDVFNSRLGSVYQISDNFYAKLLFGTSYKAPSSTQLFSNFIVPQGVIGNPNLKPERARTFEAAVGTQIRQHLSLQVNGFYNIVKDKVELVLPEGPVSNIIPDNTGRITSAGFEIEMQQNSQYLRSYANFSYQKSIIQKENLVRGQVKLNTDLYPSAMLKFGVNYSVPQYYLNVNLEGRAIGSRRASEVNSFIFDPVNFRIRRYTLDAYGVFDVTLTSQNLKLLGDRETRIQLKIYNVLDQQYAFPGYKNFDIPGFERSLVIGLSQHF